MAIGSMVKQSGRGMAIAAALVVAASFTTLKPAQAVDAGTAVGIAVGAALLYAGFVAPASVSRLRLRPAGD